MTVIERLTKNSRNIIVDTGTGPDQCGDTKRKIFGIPGI